MYTGAPPRSMVKRTVSTVPIVSAAAASTASVFGGSVGPGGNVVVGSASVPPHATIMSEAATARTEIENLGRKRRSWRMRPRYRGPGAFFLSWSDTGPGPHGYGVRVRPNATARAGTGRC